MANGKTIAPIGPSLWIQPARPDLGILESTVLLSHVD
jgi:hypothetical protein